MNSSHSDHPTLSRGFLVFIGLALLSGIEFWVAVGGIKGVFPLLAIVALAKSALIIEYYMHVSKTRQPDEEDQHE